MTQALDRPTVSAYETALALAREGLYTRDMERKAEIADLLDMDSNPLWKQLNREQYENLHAIIGDLNRHLLSTY